MALFYERVYRSRNVGETLHGGLVELLRPTHSAPTGREIVGATFVLLDATKGLLVAERFKLAANIIYQRLFAEFFGVNFAALAEYLEGDTHAIETIKGVHADVEFLGRYGTLHLIVRPRVTNFLDLPYLFAMYSTLLAHVARVARRAIGDVVITPLSTRAGVVDMGQMLNAMHPLVAWRGAVLPEATNPMQALNELSNGYAHRALEAPSTIGAPIGGFFPIIAAIHNLNFPQANETLLMLLAAGVLDAWHRD